MDISITQSEAADIIDRKLGARTASVVRSAQFNGDGFSVKYSIGMLGSVNIRIQVTTASESSDILKIKVISATLYGLDLFGIIRGKVNGMLFAKLRKHIPVIEKDDAMYVKLPISVRYIAFYDSTIELSIQLP